MSKLLYLQKVSLFVVLNSKTIASNELVGSCHLFFCDDLFDFYKKQKGKNRPFFFCHLKTAKFKSCKAN